MDIKKKILLGEKDILAKENEDLFLNINLNSTYKNIRNDKYENVFDVEKQFKKERNSSRDFRIYGIIDSTVADCGNLSLNVYSTSGITGLSGLVKTTTSTPLVYDGINVYGKKRGKYIIDLESYEHDFVYIEIPSNNLNFKNQSYIQQVIFRDTTGQFVEYGTQTIDIGEDGNAISINNDFYFLYNKHWIKKDLLIIEEKPAKIFINTTDVSTLTNELTTIADRVTIDISLDKPSPFGLEKADLNVVNSTLDLGEIIIVDSGNTVLPLPYTFQFAPGEQHKIIYFYSPTDFIQEFLEDVVIGLENFVNVSTGSPLQYTIQVADITPRNKVKVNFQDVYQNRNYFSGRFFSGSTGIRISSPMPSVLRNGLFFEGTPMEFYPSDNYTLKIQNVGNNTILPVNSKLGIATEKLFLTNQELSFNITQEYVNTAKNSIKFTFKNLNWPLNSTQYYSFDKNFLLNGVPLVKYGYNLRISFKDFLAYLTKSIPPNLASTIDGWSYGTLEAPFDVSADEPNLTITITAKSPGTRLDWSYFGVGMFDIFNISPDDFDNFGVKAEIVDPFIYDNQVPLEFELGANTGSNLFAQYKFTILKNGYDGMAFTCSPLAASLNPDTYYLVSGLNTVLRNWDDSTSTPVYFHENVTSNWGVNANATNPTYGKYKTGEVYINGMVLLANQYLSNTLTYSSTPSSAPALNQSHAINLSSDFSHDFLPSPISVIPDTNSILAVSDVAQYGYLAILKPNFGTAASPPAGVGSKRSFDFRTGSTNTYNTFYTNDYYNYGGFMWSSMSSFYSSGGTVPNTNSPTLSKPLKTFLETGQVTPSITPQGIQGVGASLPWAYYTEFSNLYATNNNTNTQNVEGANALSVIRLESQAPGVPFEIKNTKELKYISGPNIGQDYTKGSIFYIEARPNQKAGVSINLANNKMGGFSVTHP